MFFKSHSTSDSDCDSVDVVTQQTPIADEDMDVTSGVHEKMTNLLAALILVQYGITYMATLRVMFTKSEFSNQTSRRTKPRL